MYGTYGTFWHMVDLGKVCGLHNQQQQQDDCKISDEAKMPHRSFCY